MRHLKEKVDAGADFIVTQFFYDVEKFLDFLGKCREIGITCPIIPGVMPIQSYTTLVKMTRYCGVAVPSSVWNRLEAVNKNDDEAVKRLGCEIAVKMCQQIYARSKGDIDGFHFYTLNLERIVTEIIGMLNTTSLRQPIQQQQQQSVATPLGLRKRFTVLEPKSPTSPQRRQDEVRYEISLSGSIILAFVPNAIFLPCLLSVFPCL